MTRPLKILASKNPSAREPTIPFSITTQGIQIVGNKLNTRPRKALGYNS
jgi:hypothetical protein